MIDRRALMRSGGIAAAAFGLSVAAPTAHAADAGPGAAHGHGCPGGHGQDRPPGGPIDPCDPTSGVTRVELQRNPSPARGWLTVQTLVEIPRHKESGRHSHPGVEVGYIVRGDVLMVFDDGPAQRLRTGDPFFIPSGAIHNARNVGTVTTMMLSTYVIDETKPLVTTY